jgi:hypothetical protein
MATSWCVNFDADESVLDHGILESLWLMQYQYSHDGHTYQGGANQIAATSRNWNALREVKPGDWLVAYMRGSRFFAIGEVTEPRRRNRHRGQPPQEDTICRTKGEHRHRFLSGIVRYEDAPVFYEDFTDTWNRPVTNALSGQTEVWRYPQRIDVGEWCHVVPSGVKVEGLAEAVPFPRFRLAVFEIPEDFFDEVRARLKSGAGR